MENNIINNNYNTISTTINKIESSINNIPTIRKALNEISKDQSENTCQTLIDKCLLDSVVAFQRYCDIMYSKHTNAKSKIPFNNGFSGPTTFIFGFSIIGATRRLNCKIIRSIKA